MAQRNRGKHPNDDKNFNQKWQRLLKEAVVDLSYLLTKGYSDKSSLQLVGNRYRLNSRQQKALMRLSADKNKLSLRTSKAIFPAQLAQKMVVIDGFNLLILLENALSGAYLFKCLDGTYRDISSVHGSYKRVVKTEEAIILVGHILKLLEVQQVVWLLDAPVSNSGRLKQMLLRLAETHQFSWKVELVNNPDKQLAESECVVVSSDAWILDRCQEWFNLGAYLIETQLNVKHIVEAV